MSTLLSGGWDSRWWSDVSLCRHSAGLISGLADQSKEICMSALLSCMWAIVALATSAADSQWV